MSTEVQLFSRATSSKHIADRKISMKKTRNWMQPTNTDKNSIQVHMLRRSIVIIMTIHLSDVHVLCHRIFSIFVVVLFASISNLCHLEKPLFDLMSFIYWHRPYIAIICCLWTINTLTTHNVCIWMHFLALLKWLGSMHLKGREKKKTRMHSESQDWSQLKGSTNTHSTFFVDDVVVICRWEKSR